jgi:dihydropteroate synthase
MELSTDHLPSDQSANQSSHQSGDSSTGVSTERRTDANSRAAELAAAIAHLDNQLSNRFIELDPAGYFIIFLDRETAEICADHYSNDINEQGLAADPETGEVLACQGDLQRSPQAQYRGKSAKELGIKLTEAAHPCPLTKLDHALYLGRELVRAEQALLNGSDYIQD